MKTIGYVVRLLVTVIVASVVLFGLQRDSYLPLTGMVAVAIFIIYFSIGNLIFALSKIGIKAHYYRYVALPGYPLLVALAMLQIQSGINWNFSWWVGASLLIYLFCSFLHQDAWIGFLGDTYRAQVKDVLLFPIKDIKSRDQLMQAEVIVNGFAATAAIWLLMHLS